MTAYNQGDVVLVSFPFTDLTSTKKRPALVVSARWFNERPEGDRVLAAITSVIRSPLARDETLVPDSDLTQAGLLKPSIVKAGKLFTLNENLIYKRLGTLPDESFRAVVARLEAILGL